MPLALHDRKSCSNLAVMQLGNPVDERLPWIRTIGDLDAARQLGTPAARIEALTKSGRQLGDDLRAGPRVIGVKTLNNTTLPYPTRFAFNGAVPLPWPMIIMWHRTLLIKLQTADGVRHVLFNPTDRDTSRNTPFFRRLATKVDKVAPFATKLLAKAFDPLEDQLAALGIAPEQIDIIAYDHFHTQDLRPNLGDGTNPGRFPNALLLAPLPEWNDWDGLHPMQRSWFIEDGKRGVPRDRVVLTNSDLALGDGCLLLRTPGHTVGNQTLFVHADEGVFGCSENGCSADNWAPRQSAIAGLAKFAKAYDVDVVLNANTPELGGEQYVSMMLERAVVDPAPTHPDMVQMFPSSETTASLLAPSINPSLVFGNRDSGVYAR